MGDGGAGAEDVGALHSAGSVFTEKRHAVLIFAEPEERHVDLMHFDSGGIVLASQIPGDVQIIGIFCEVHVTVNKFKPRVKTEPRRLFMGAVSLFSCRDEADKIGSEFHCLYDLLRVDIIILFHNITQKESLVKKVQELS